MLNKNIIRTINALSIESVAAERRALLKPLIEYVQTKKNHQQPVRLNFICTHNSRRSHLAQVWAQAVAYHYKISNMFCYSGGTTATAVCPAVLQALRSAGFNVHLLSENENPVFAIKFSDKEHPVIGFSKRFDHLFNPKKSFAAIMVCSQADENCPFVPGAEKRFAIPYEDPKIYDDTPHEAHKYEKRSLQIATEMIYVFSQITL